MFHVFGHPVVVRDADSPMTPEELAALPPQVRWARADRERHEALEAERERRGSLPPGVPFVDPAAPRPPASWTLGLHQLLRARRWLGALGTLVFGVPFLVAFWAIAGRVLPTDLRGAAPWVLALVILAMVLGVGVRVWRATRGYGAPRALAERLGLRWYVTDGTLAHRWRRGPFAGTDGATATEVLTGTWRGREVVALHHAAVRGSQDSAAATRVRRVAAIALPAALPWVELTPQGPVDRVRTAFGGQDLVLESAAFNDAWLVRAEDPRAAHALLHPRVMERLLRPDARALSFLVEGPDLVAWSDGEGGLDRTAERFDLLADLLDLVPGHLWVDHTPPVPQVWLPEGPTG